MSISYEYYKIFYYVARYKSFNRAAKVLLNSQPNIARAINNLESELGCTLFERSHRGVTLTTQGDALFGYVSEAHRQLVNGEEAVKRINSGRVNTVTLGLSTGITDFTVRNRILPPIRDFSQSSPNINLRLINDSTPNLTTRIEEGELDLAVITTTNLSDPSLRKHILYTFNEIPIAGNSFRDELYGKTISMADLVKYPLITMARDTESFSYHDQLFAKNGFILSPYIETHTMRQALAFCENDMGITCLEEEYVRPSIDAGLIFQITLIEGLPHKEISLIRNTKSRTYASTELEKSILRFNRDMLMQESASK